jgi:hypothetical protein
MRRRRHRLDVVGVKARAHLHRLAAPALIGQDPGVVGVFAPVGQTFMLGQVSGLAWRAGLGQVARRGHEQPAHGGRRLDHQAGRRG